MKKSKRYNFIQVLEQKISDDFYYLYQSILQQKYRRLTGKWNRVSRVCYDLEQQLHSRTNERKLRQYKHAYAKAGQLKIAVREMENKLNKR